MFCCLELFWEGGGTNTGFHLRKEMEPHLEWDKEESKLEKDLRVFPCQKGEVNGKQDAPFH